MKNEIEQIKENISKMVDKINSLVDVHSSLYDNKKPLKYLDRCDDKQLMLLLSLTDNCWRNIKTAEELLRYTRNILSMHTD